jgi:hypothetical protein
MREQAKIKQKRENCFNRRGRLLKARQRLIGIDVQALDAQVEEKRRNRDASKEAERMECTY